MAIYCLGSINADHFYAVPHIPAPGETLAATELKTGLGGKGANQSVAAARAGAEVHHIGAIGPDSSWIIDRFETFGVDTTHVAVLDVPTGHAIISVDADGENSIIIFSSANVAQSAERIEAALANAGPGDVLLIQNETNKQVEAARSAAARGMSVMYSAAPFDADAVRAVLEHIDVLLLNEIEAAQLEKALDQSLQALAVARIVITLGAKGARMIDTQSGDQWEVGGIPVEAVDTTGAGDTFAGYLAAGLHAGLGPEAAMQFAGRAAALKVTRHGTADAIPSRAEVEAFSS